MSVFHARVRFVVVVAWRACWCSWSHWRVVRTILVKRLQRPRLRLVAR
jgi:hypothetical protein